MFHIQFSKLAIMQLTQGSALLTGTSQSDEMTLKSNLANALTNKKLRD